MASTSFSILLNDKMSSGLGRISQMGSKTFSRLNNLQNKFNRNIDKGSENASRLASKINLVNQQGQKSNTIFSRLSGIMGGMIAIGGISQLGSNIIATTAKFERFEAVLTNTLGSKEKAVKNMEMIQNFASKTPFGVDELTDSFLKLTNRGLQPNIAQMTKMGNLASSVGKKYDQLTEAVLDATTGEFERLKEFGIKARKSGNQVQFTFKGVSKTVAFTEKAIQGYIYSLGELKGVKGSMAAIAKTLGGGISNLSDKFIKFQVRLGKMLRPVMIKVIDTMSKLLDYGEHFTGWLSRNKKFIIPFVRGMGLAIGALTAFQTISYLVSLVNPFGLIMAGVTLLIAGISTLYNRFNGFRVMVDNVVNSIKPSITELTNSFGGLFSNIGKLFSGEINGKMYGFLHVVTKVFGVIFKAAAFNMKIWMKLFTIFNKVTSGIVSAINYMKPQIIELWNKMAGFREGVWRLWESIGKFFTRVAEKIKNLFGGIGRIIAKLFEKFGFGDAKGITKAFSTGFNQKSSLFQSSNNSSSKGLLSGISDAVGSLANAGNTPGLAATAGIAGVTGGAASRTINISIDTLAKIEYHNQTVKESASDLTEQIKGVLLTAVNDVNLVQ